MSIEEPSHNFSVPPPEHPAPKRPVAERKIRANRKNALRSTGPKTERGKRNVSRNAIKHGFLAREVVITAGHGAENLQEFHTLVEELRKSYEPIGVIEETLVQTIATCLWRKARVIRAENGEIRKRLDTVQADLVFRNSDKANFERASSELDFGLYSGEDVKSRKRSPQEIWAAIQLAQSNLREHPTGLGHLRALLEIAKSDLDKYGYITELIREKIFLAFCFWDYYFAIVCLNAGSPESMMRCPPSETVVKTHSEQEPPDVRALIEERLERNSLFTEYAVVRERHAVDAEARSFSLPPADATDKLIRYESHLDRQLYRAMDQLERLQRQRRGESVPPPVNVNLGTRH